MCPKRPQPSIPVAIHDQILQLYPQHHFPNSKEATRSIWAGSKCPIEDGDFKHIAETMFEGLDLNSDGIVSFAEFVQAALNGNFVGGSEMMTAPSATSLLQPPGSPAK